MLACTLWREIINFAVYHSSWINRVLICLDFGCEDLFFQSLHSIQLRDYTMSLPVDYFRRVAVTCVCNIWNSGKIYGYSQWSTQSTRSDTMSYLEIGQECRAWGYIMRPMSTVQDCVGKGADTYKFYTGLMGTRTVGSAYDYPVLHTTPCCPRPLLPYPCRCTVGGCDTEKKVMVKMDRTRIWV